MSYHAEDGEDISEHEPAGRFLRREDLNDLKELLIGTDDSVESGLSQIGIDPDEFTESDFDFILRRTRLVFDEDRSCWVEDD